MDFELTKEQEAIKRFAREFCDKEVLPLADKIEKENKISVELINKLAEWGTFGIPMIRNTAVSVQGTRLRPWCWRS